MSLNHVTLLGRITKDVELRVTDNNVSVANFTVAVDRDYSSGAKKETDFIDCVAWRTTADFIKKHFQKGRMICLSGRLQSRKWKDKQDNPRVSWEVVAETAYFCGDRDNALTEAAKEETEGYGELPF